MKHITLDCYGASQHNLNDLTTVYQLLNDVAYKFNLEPIAPPHLIPYYYGRVKKDSGISAFILLRGGHITIHTFPFRECYFVDIFSPSDFDENKIRSFFEEDLPFDPKVSNIELEDRNNRAFNISPYSPDCDFGPHLMTEIEANKNYSLDDLYSFLEQLVVKIDMDPITRACVNKDRIEFPKYLSGIIIIAQSHIALHYEIATGRIYADIFSCAAFDYGKVEKELSVLGKIVSNVLVPRGTKHIYKVQSDITDEELASSTLWQKNLGINRD